MIYNKQGKPPEASVFSRLDRIIPDNTPLQVWKVEFTAPIIQAKHQNMTIQMSLGQSHNNQD